MAGEDTGVRVERSGAVMTTTLDRPDVHNALDWRAREAMVAALTEASADAAVRAVVITGSGERAFCTGADLRVPFPVPDKPAGAPERVQGDVARRVMKGWQQSILAVLDCEKPVVAAVNGTAAGAGMHLALACDVVVMSDATKLVPVFVRRGIAPDAAGPYLLTRVVGPQRAKQIYFFGDDIPAAQAYEWGLVTQLAPASEVVATATALAERLANGPTRALAVTKRLLNSALDVDRQTALTDEAWGQELVMSSQDAQEGVRAFVERRDTSFKGW
ncbi:MAG: enoyl-CoA hydratase/isomerase family protein [Mycobacteriales bacterium]